MVKTFRRKKFKIRKPCFVGGDKPGQNYANFSVIRKLHRKQKEFEI